MILQRIRGQDPAKKIKQIIYLQWSLWLKIIKLHQNFNLTKNKYPARYNDLPDKGDMLVTESA